MSEYVNSIESEDDSVHDGLPPMIEAADAGDEVRALTLFGEGADIEETDGDSDCTVLWYAAMRGLVCLVNVLLIAGADWEADDHDGYNALHIAADRGNVAIVAALCTHARANDLGIVERQTIDGLSALQVATVAGHFDVVRFLLGEGSDIDQVDDDGYTALHFAARDGRLQIARLLIRHGATLDVRDDAGHTALTIAQRYHHHDVERAIQTAL